MVSEVERDKRAMGLRTLIENRWDTEMREAFITAEPPS